jgi:hypothetical protein
MVLGLVGGLLALMGALIGWLMIQTCASALGISMCVAVPLPPGFAIGSYDALMGIAPLLTMIFGLVGVVFAVLRKPLFALLAGVFGIVSLLLCVLYLVRAGGLASQLNSIIGGTGGSVSLSVGASIGLYLSLIGALLLTVGGFMQWKGLKGASAPKA